MFNFVILPRPITLKVLTAINNAFTTAHSLRKQAVQLFAILLVKSVVKLYFSELRYTNCLNSRLGPDPVKKNFHTNLRYAGFMQSD